MKKLFFVLSLAALSGCENLGIGPKEPKEPKPTVDFNFMEDADGNQSFTSSTTGKIDSYWWTLGNQKGTVLPNVPNAFWYEKNGTYNVSLKVTGPGGEATATKGVQVRNIRGSRVFFSTNATAQISVVVNNSFSGTITNRHTTTPTCDTQDAVKFNLKAGDYSYVAIQGNSRWAGNFRVESGECGFTNLTQ